jgi:hypothetical protein
VGDINGIEVWYKVINVTRIQMIKMKKKKGEKNEIKSDLSFIINHGPLAINFELFGLMALLGKRNNRN